MDPARYSTWLNHSITIIQSESRGAGVPGDHLNRPGGKEAPLQRTFVTRLPGRRDQLEESRKVIEFDLKRLTLDLANATDCQLLEGTLANHPADEASDLIVAEIDLSRIRELQAEIRDIDEALERIERGVYGACVECGDEIDPARLNILPLAQRCPSCQTRYDATPAQ